MQSWPKYSGFKNSRRSQTEEEFCVRAMNMAFLETEQEMMKVPDSNRKKFLEIHPTASPQYPGNKLHNADLKKHQLQ